MEDTWITTNVYSEMPAGAVVAGQDADGEAILVGRAYHEGVLLPAKVVPSRQQAYVAYDGREIEKHDVEILIGDGYEWLRSCAGDLPSHAIAIRRNDDDEPLYLGRGRYNNSLTPGHVHPSEGYLRIPYGGGEQCLAEYEVLVRHKMWLSSPCSCIVPGTVHAGTDADGDAIYVGRAYHCGDMLPAKVIPSKGVAYVSHNGQEFVKHDVELLVGDGYGWVAAKDGHVPPRAIHCGQTSDGQRLYIGRGYYGGSMMPGKVHPSHGCLYIPFDGQEMRLNDYEVLIKVTMDH